MSEKPKKIVLAYSGGLDTSVILGWLIETYGAEVIAFCADLGQGEELAPVEAQGARPAARARSTSRTCARSSCATSSSRCCAPTRSTKARYLLGTSIARPLIAKRQVEIAIAEGADAVAHGATGKGNDQVRFELTYYALEPDIRVIAPWRLWDLNSRTKLIAYAEQQEDPDPGDARRSRTAPTATCCTSATKAASSKIRGASRTRTCSCSPCRRRRRPTRPEYVEIDFEAGDPVRGERRAPVAGGAAGAAERRSAARHGIGRVDLVENRYVGMKSRGVYETPGGTILHVAHRAVESLTLDREVLHLRDSLIPRYAEMVYYGYWFAPERQHAADRHRRSAAHGHRHRAPQALQGQRHRRRPQVAALALPARHRDLRGRLGLPAGRRGGLHPAQRAAPEDPRASRCEKRPCARTQLRTRIHESRHRGVSRAAGRRPSSTPSPASTPMSAASASRARCTSAPSRCRTRASTS